MKRCRLLRHPITVGLNKTATTNFPAQTLFNFCFFVCFLSLFPFTFLYYLHLNCSATRSRRAIWDGDCASLIFFVLSHIEAIAANVTCWLSSPFFLFFSFLFFLSSYWKASHVGAMPRDGAFVFYLFAITFFHILLR
ncbi:hypothetical protein, unlikely [Trypanosoma congolense IL3000]|uniref:Uncharacterized protein n=1 Tax=Trypanosoma congolense (strain IL3000) TaxID=1068625 RepID=F9W9E2_TRYCI|nr:hypothetical protein, unlikely [Trypanosoma congolense IL3000]CCD13842.1 hypothetical protein, unlikely [Trypanosoma congolense IL3000]